MLKIIDSKTLELTVEGDAPFEVARINNEGLGIDPGGTIDQIYVDLDPCGMLEAKEIESDEYVIFGAICNDCKEELRMAACELVRGDRVRVDLECTCSRGKLIVVRKQQ